MSRVSIWRKRLNDHYRGPEAPFHDSRDLNYFFTYIDRRAVLNATAGFVADIAAAALLSTLVLGYADRLFMLLLIAPYWYVAWHFYLRKRYRPEFQDPPSVTPPGASDPV